ncbi:hypothetical protein Ancab_005787 [Ancistrocladus abbreviatus]
MYVTRPLSLYRKSPSALSVQPPDEAPHKGFIVVKDEEAEEEDSYCWGACDHREVKQLPFPQNKILAVVHPSDASVTKVWFLPVLNQPLSSNHYYVIKAKGKYKGRACTSSRRADICTCCFTKFMNDINPRPFDHRDIYQQFEIRRYYDGGFYAKSAAYDGVPPKFLRQKGWKLRISRSICPEPGDALGLDDSVQATITLPPSQNLPLLPINHKQSAVVIGRWYCPFLFIKEEAKLNRRMKKSLFYEITLEQYWQEIYSKENENSGEEEYEEEDNSTVRVNVIVKKEEFLVYGMEAVIDGTSLIHGFVWYKGFNGSGGRGVKLGLSSSIVENMRGIEEERGWIDGGGGCSEVVDLSVEERRRRGSNNRWRRFGCYILVESFLVRRMDGVLIMKYNFRHTDKVQCKWQ